MGQTVSVWHHLHRRPRVSSESEAPFCINSEHTVYRSLQQLSGIFQRRRVQKLRKVDYSVFLWLHFLLLIASVCLLLRLFYKFNLA